MLSKLSAGQLAKVFNAVTDRAKPVRKFESHARGLALTIAELDRMHVTAPVALARAGLPVPATEAEPKLLTYAPAAPVELKPAGRTPRMGAKPGRETLKRSERQFVPTATDAVTGAPVDLRSLHGPVRTVEGDPEKAARKVGFLYAKVRNATWPRPKKRQSPPFMEVGRNGFAEGVGSARPGRTADR